MVEWRLVRCYVSPVRIVGFSLNNTVLRENITVKLVGALHVPVEWTGSGEQSFNRLKGAIASLRIDCEEKVLGGRQEDQNLRGN